MKKKQNETRGRPTRYKSEYAEQAYKLCLLRATDAELADFFGVVERTINTWKQRHPIFLQSITRGKEMADAEMAASLFRRGMGYSHPEDKIFLHEGNPVIVPTIKHYPPDTQAASLWLRNRQPAKWRDKVSLEHTGKDGGPIQHAWSDSDLDGKSDEELSQLYAAAAQTTEPSVH